MMKNQGVISAEDPVCIVGVGACTSVGLNAEATAAAVRASIDNFQEHPYMINQEGDPYVLAMVPSIDTDLSGCDRYIAMSTPAISEALSALQQTDNKKHDLKAAIALPELRPGLPANIGEEISNHIKGQSNDHYEICEVKTSPAGHAGGLMALESASRLIELGKSEFCLVGGIDSYIDPDTLDWIEDNEQLHVPSNAWGFIPGEAATFCLLCSTSTANKYGIPVKAQLVSIHTAQEQNRIKTKSVCIGDGLTKAVAGAISGLPKDYKINFTICDQNGEAYRADEYGFMLCRLSGKFEDPSGYMAPADCWGDVGAASGPLFVNLLIAASEKGYSKGSYTLLWASSEGGNRTAALLHTAVSNERAS